MRNAAIAASLLCLLSGCGDDAGGSPKDPSKAPSKALTPAELGEALKRGNADPQVTARELEATLKEQLGPHFADGAAKAKEMTSRPLTAAHVEQFLELAPVLYPIRKDMAATGKALTARGTTFVEYTLMMGRIMAARMQLRTGKDPADELRKQDVEVVRPYADRIDAAVKTR